MRRGFSLIVCLLTMWACSSSRSTSDVDGGWPAGDDSGGGSIEGSIGESGLPLDAGSPSGDASIRNDSGLIDAAASCTTRVTYGQSWLHAANHPAQFDDVPSTVTWDGTCTDDGSNSYAVLSNGWKPIFQGPGACTMAFDYKGSCSQAQSPCTTRITYGAAWAPPANHPLRYDDVTGRVFPSGSCTDSGASSFEGLSNGWTPYFNGNGACEMSLRYEQCGGLYANPVIPFDCPDPGVLADGAQYVLTCTSGDAADAYPIFTSPDLANWTPQGHIFPAGHWPSWAVSDFWAPEIHKVGSQYVAYFSARGGDGRLAIGAASAPSSTGPFTDVGQPLLHSTSHDFIDANEINASDGTSYAIWKDDGSVAGGAIVIRGQPLAAGGLSATGGSSVLIGVDQAWEGPLVEGPFMIEHAGTYYLFYSANPYDTTAYAIGVAQSGAALGPFTKSGGPILSTGGAWAGPGHCSVVDTPAGDTYVVYHAWEAGHVGNGNGPGRLVLTDAIEWGGGWPSVPFAPSSASRPLP